MATSGVRKYYFKKKNWIAQSLIQSLQKPVTNRTCSVNGPVYILVHANSRLTKLCSLLIFQNFFSILAIFFRQIPAAENIFIFMGN